MIEQPIQLELVEKLTDDLSVLGNYSTEDGGRATSNDPFTELDQTGSTKL